MRELQALLTGWLIELTAVLPSGIAFGVGIVVAVNPCGLAILPASLALPRRQRSGLQRVTWDDEPPRPVSSGYKACGAREELENNILPLLG